MRKIFYSISALVIIGIVSAATLWSINDDPKAPYKVKRMPKAQRIEGAIEDWIFTSSDVETGEIPHHKRFAAIAEAARRTKAREQNRGGGGLANAIWRERGPNNVGGRTRALMIDEKDPNRNRIWIGGVSGGVWRTEDITQNDPKWEKVGIHFSTTSIGDIAQDPTNLNTIYVGTGESYTGDFLGVGIYKTTDDGETWTLLPSTVNFQYVNEILVHTNGDVYAATASNGLMRSTNGGDTWEKVLGTSLSGASSNDFHDIVFNEVSQMFYTSNDNSVFKSATGNRGDWENIGNGRPGFPLNLTRVELAVCASNPEVMYVLGAIGVTASNTFVSNDGGKNWTSRSAPGVFPGQDFTNGQAWYDLEIAADPFNCGRILAGGVGMLESSFQGITWQPIADGQIHVDHHYIVFDDKKQGRVFYGNDGGVWMSNNGGNTIMNKNAGYVTTQFYCAAIHPDAGSPYCLGGTQDNNSLQLTQGGLGPANSVWGGDGVFCFIDQNEPHIQIVSSQNGNYGLSTDGGDDFGFGTNVDGAFINRSGYDDSANILYGQINTGGYFRWKVNEFVTEEVDIAGQNMNVSAVKVDPHVPNRVYFGGASGKVVRVDNAHQGTLVTGTVFADFPGTASVSSIYIDSLSADHVLVSLFNYGANLDNIFVTYNGGAEWTSIEGDLPDVPVRWAIFDPTNHDRVMIATDVGIWTTEDVDGSNTHWEPTNPENGMPFVRVDMLLLRASDNVVLAATHGRGLMTTEIFSSAAPVIVAQPIGYEGQNFVFDGSFSVNAQSFEWNFGDSNTSTEPTANHVFNAPGVYNVSLTINGSITKSQTVTILPYLPAPYEEGVAEYAGDFESAPEHFAGFTLSGTGFQRGNSIKAGKDGTHSGANAWVLGINDNVYQNNGRAELYTPQYDLSVPGLYELKFWAKYSIQNRNDGFQVEYSTDSGASWFQLGSKEDPNWYNYLNLNIADGGFPQGKAYFTNTQLNWIQYTKDISFLAGQPKVAFRYVFRSDDSEPAPGLVIDDFEITKYEGELRTTVTVFNADYTGEQEVTVNWTTGVEYQAKQFILERSFTGFGFSEIATLPASAGTTTVPQIYQFKDQSLRNVIYYRIKSINDNPDLNYHLEFYTDTIVVRRNVEPDVVHNVLTNPFKDVIHVSFSSVVNQPVIARLYDLAGKLVVESIQTPNSVSMELNGLRLPQGIYVLSVQVEDGDIKTYKMLTLGY